MEDRLSYVVYVHNFTGIAGVMFSNPIISSQDFFRLIFCNCSSCVHNNLNDLPFTKNMINQVTLRELTS